MCDATVMLHSVGTQHYIQEKQHKSPRTCNLSEPPFSPSRVNVTPAMTPKRGSTKIIPRVEYPRMLVVSPDRRPGGP